MRRLILLLLLVYATPSAADTLHVPSDFSTIQAAVNAAAPGDVIRIAPGRYEEAVLIQDTSELVLRGEPGTEWVAPEGWYALAIFDSEDIRIERLRIFPANVESINIGGSSRVRVRECEFLGGFGAIIAGGSEKVVIERNFFDSQHWRSIFLSDLNSPVVNDSRIARNEFILTIGIGVLVEGTNNVIARNRFEAVVSSTAILGEGDASDNLYARNRMTRSWLYTDGPRERAVRNVVTDAEFTGIALVGSAGEAIRNKVRGGGGCVGLGSGGRAKGNRCTDNVRALWAGSGNEIVRNRVVRPSGYGVRLGADNVVRRNVVRDAADDAFVVAQGGNTLSRNRARESGGFDLLDESSTGTNVYKANRFGSVEITPAP